MKFVVGTTVSPPATKPQTPKPALSLISYRTEEHDRYFDVQKSTMFLDSILTW
jgi:hypothetical protein